MLLRTQLFCITKLPHQQEVACGRGAEGAEEETIIASTYHLQVLNFILETHRKRRAEDAIKARLEEEAIMEARRRELLSEEGGYWSRRMAAEAAATEQLAAAQRALVEVQCLPCHA